MKDSSDIEILVEIEKDISLLDFVALKLEFEKTLAERWIWWEFDTIKPRLRERILKEQV